QDELGEALADVDARTGSAIELANGQIETFVKIVVGLGPQATLKRGFAITRDAQGRPVTSASAASTLEELTVEYHDGRITTVTQADRAKEG
ncbi:exodeoxyribonuclease VII large subunit, partial [Singulisphaera rosea]